MRIKSLLMKFTVEWKRYLLQKTSSFLGVVSLQQDIFSNFFSFSVTKTKKKQKTNTSAEEKSKEKKVWKQCSGCSFFFPPPLF
jgi:hypothetical protein